jgi:hypothetical protein
MPRGGRRTGTPGKAYSNRSDLNVPAQAASGQQYGMRGQQMAAQRALPVARPATDAVPSGGSPAAGGPAGAGTPAGPLPGSLTPLDAPTQRPGEPVTTGLPVGAGAGPEALGPLGQLESDNGAKDLAMYLPALEFIASQPGATAQTRNLVRRLRGAAGGGLT